MLLATQAKRTDGTLVNVKWTLSFSCHVGHTHEYKYELPGSLIWSTGSLTWNPSGGCGAKPCATEKVKGNGYKSGGTVKPQPEPTPTPITEGYDWRDTSCGKTVTVLNQGQCGSCYTQAATQVVRHRYCMKYGNSAIEGTFSPQFPMSCNSETFDCNGGWPATVINWMNDNPITNVCCFPYNQGRGGSISGRCPTSGCSLLSVTKNPYAANGVISENDPSSPFLGCKHPPGENQAPTSPLETQRYSNTGKA